MLKIESKRYLPTKEIPDSGISDEFS